MTDKKYAEYYSKESLWEKLKSNAKKAGVKVVYASLILFYAMESKNVGLKTKVSIAAALGYFILPTDAIFDLTPLIGYSDDLGVLLFVLSQVASSITPEVKEKARQKVEEWFSSVDPEDIAEIELKIE
eukprot:TRINITY_DN81780_c0_g1_i1.p1 TRINITY_DN81780_c0_g1~~TRINITY_DN81780_c0_g1_i1.p1  ORF type:complete len:128 (-),score=22.64 TRINITY_DN81780_c0_g1_i1:199-582(-)